MSNPATWKSVSLSILYQRKRKALTLKYFSVSDHPDKKTAMGYAYATKGYTYMKKDGDQVIIWSGNPSHNTHLYEFVLIGKVSGPGVDMQDKRQLRKFREMFEEMYNDWINHKGKKLYPDQSLMLDRLAWQTSIPKGYKLLRVGSVIEEGDQEFTEYHGSKFWSDVSHYHVGQKVKKGHDIRFISAEGNHLHKGDKDPLIIRKISRS